MNLLKIPSIYKLEVLEIMYKINTKTLPNSLGDFLQISSKTLTRFAIGNNYSYYFLAKLFHNLSFAIKVLSFEMSYQMNLKITLIKADMLS